MRILLDTNVVLDVLLRRDPWFTSAATIWRMADESRLNAFIPASVITDIFYVARRLTDRQKAWQAVVVCLEAFSIARVDRSTLEKALTLSGDDFEDNVQIACALSHNLDAIVTRNVNDFPVSSIPVLSPDQCLERLKG